MARASPWNRAKPENLEKVYVVRGVGELDSLGKRALAWNCPNREMFNKLISCPEVGELEFARGKRRKHQRIKSAKHGDHQKRKA
jgi:hypothetical protein